MENLYIYAIRDRVAGVYGDIFTCAKDELAIRRFNYIMSNSKMVANDCSLYKLGIYDANKGFVSPLIGGDGSCVENEFICDYEGGDDNA